MSERIQLLGKIQSLLQEREEYATSDDTLSEILELLEFERQAAHNGCASREIHLRNDSYSVPKARYLPRFGTNPVDPEDDGDNHPSLR